MGAGSSAPVQAETAGPPSKKSDKKKLWIIIAVILVAALLIGSATYVFVLGGDELEATIDPDTVSVAAGGYEDLTVEATWNGDSLADNDDVEYLWSVDPDDLGGFDRVAQPEVTFEAGNEGGDGTIECTVTYGGKSVTASAEITVDPPFLDMVTISPSTKTIGVDESWSFIATASDSIGGNVTADADFSWTVTGLADGEYALSSTEGSIVTFTGLVEGEATLTVEAAVDDETVSGSAAVTVSLIVSERTVDYYWYDMFAVPNGPWWNDRWEKYHTEEPLTSEYPYLYRWYGAQPGNTWTYASVRMNVTGRNMTDVNMNSNPEFLPILSETVTGGGNAEINWYMQYSDYDEADAKLPDGAMAWWDGWFIDLKGTVTLDQQAATAVLGISADDWLDIDGWWATEQSAIEQAWQDWFIYEAGNDRLAIFNMYEYDFTVLYWSMDVWMDGDDVVVALDTISWGVEALMTRWLHEAFMPTEWFFEDFTMNARIGPEMSDIDIDTVCAYAVYAYETTLDTAPCWVWEALMQDYVKSTDKYPISLFDPYVDVEYENFSPGSMYYDEMMPYDYTPGAWNLSEGETLTFTWPGGEEELYLVHVAEGVTANVTGPMMVDYAEPMPGDTAFTDQIVFDNDNRLVSYIGPMDVWTWSRDQTDHPFLESEWDRIGLLPYGMPFIEFRLPPTVEPNATTLSVEGVTSPLAIGEASPLTVTVLDQFGTVFPDYAGTIEFISDDSTATLPSDYTFVPATDLGVHDFEVTFGSAGTFYITARDTVTTTLAGTQSDIVVYEPERADHFEFTGVPSLVIAGEAFDLTATVYNQWDEVMTAYAGTVNFTCTDPLAVMPANTTLTAGVYTFSVTMLTDGSQTVTAVDVDDETITGEVSFDVSPMAEADELVLAGVSYPTVVDTEEQLTITVLDQYDRVYEAFDGILEFEANSTDVTLPTPVDFVPATNLGVATVPITFTAEGWFTVWVNDTVDLTLTNYTIAWVVASVGLDHFEVTGIEDMWEGNTSDVTVTAIDDYGTVYEDYLGTIVWSTNATVGATIPTTTTFTGGDMGTVTLTDALSFDEPGVFNVTVEDQSDATKRGSQEDIVIIDLYSESLVIEEAPTEVVTARSFSLTVSVYDQFDNLFSEYDGTVTFSSSDADAGVELPGDYTFDETDAGTHDFMAAFTLVTLGTQSVTAEDDADAALSDTVSIEVESPEGLPEMTYTVYDVFEEPWGTWWEWRADSNWPTDYVLTTTAGERTMLYNPDENYIQGFLYAPYRWNVEGKNLTQTFDWVDGATVEERFFDVHHPEFMFSANEGTDEAGAEADVSYYLQYMSDEWWDGYWTSTWGADPDWPGDTYMDAKVNRDGWVVGVLMNMTLNREAAEEWLDLPQTEPDPEGWWATAESTWADDFSAWLDYEGNTRLDIWPAYEWTLDQLSTMWTLTELPSGDIEVNMAMLSWGFEMMLVRWLTESEVSTHEPYYEDLQIDLSFSEGMTNVTLDGACQYSMHAVEANQTTTDMGAWVWEPINADYAYADGSAIKPYVDNGYEYLSHNCGDPLMDTPVGYENTPGWFNLTEYQKLVFEMPSGTSVIAYDGTVVPSNAIELVDVDGDTSAYDAITYHGYVTPGYNTLGSAPSTWDNTTKTLTIEGPWEFDNTKWPTGHLYHGAPWVEFNVTPVTKSASMLESSAAPISVSTAEVVEAASMVSLAAGVSVVVLIAFVIWRRRET